MNETTTTEAPTTEPAVKQPTKPVTAKPARPAKKPAAKPAAKKAPAPSANGTAEAMYGIERSHDLPWNEKKVKIFKALKSCGATSSGSARDAVKLAEKAGVTNRDVRHYCYHAKAAGLVGVVEQEGQLGYGFHLTAKGAKLDPVAELKKQQSAKS